MTDSKIIIRYGCDGGCGRIFENKDELLVIGVQQFRGGHNGRPIYTTERLEMLCSRCYDQRNVPSLEGTDGI